MIRPINRWRSMFRCRVPKISVSANSIVAKMLLALQIRPAMETRANQPTDCLTPSSAFWSSGWALAGNSWITRTWRWNSVPGSRITSPMIASAPRIKGNIDMNPANASASA